MRRVLASPETVTVVFTWKVNKGKDAEFRAWMHGIASDATKAPGHLGVTTLKIPGGSGVYQSVVKFDNKKSLDRWFDSKTRKSWVERLDGIAVEHKTELTGVETWFEAPGVNPPPRWKMVIATFIAVYPLALLLGWLIAPHIIHYNIFLRSLLFPIILPLALTYVLMPIVTQRLLKHWLYE